jgi:hypothetical protein
MNVYACIGTLNSLASFPNGAGIGNFLAQHKPKLGHWEIKSIEVFAADSQASGIRELSIAWKLKDIPHGFR